MARIPWNCSLHRQSGQVCVGSPTLLGGADVREGLVSPSDVSEGKYTRESVSDTHQYAWLGPSNE
ncbi:hypothetical protein NW768_007152 [Fusarium equiseti]|uniref:Uncharacterized protein n=1 Tax=Fusarium equiseti TaxID=61235 RepID=A0ABQ8RA83_FUSEQ|nr:hypothetical protein NW768_007152 [Fusarium equiseti]